VRRVGAVRSAGVPSTVAGVRGRPVVRGIGGIRTVGACIAGRSIGRETSGYGVVGLAQAADTALIPSVRRVHLAGVGRGLVIAPQTSVGRLVVVAEGVVGEGRVGAALVGAVAAAGAGAERGRGSLVSLHLGHRGPEIVVRP
jgi:hypothetical protein